MSRRSVLHAAFADAFALADLAGLDSARLGGKHAQFDRLTLADPRALPSDQPQLAARMASRHSLLATRKQPRFVAATGQRSGRNYRRRFAAFIGLTGGGSSGHRDFGDACPAPSLPPQRGSKVIFNSHGFFDRGTNAEIRYHQAATFCEPRTPLGNSLRSTASSGTAAAQELVQTCSGLASSARRFRSSGEHQERWRTTNRRSDFRGSERSGRL